ncbi:MAG: hypothetical protein WCD89_03710 [Anaerocolumna sp.]
MAVPQTGLRYAMGVRLKENLNIERMPHIDSFNLYYLWQYRRQVCGMHWV